MKKRNKIIILFLLALIVPLVGPARKNYDQSPKPCITIFIHGSITPMLKPPGPALMINLLRDQLEGTLYQRATGQIRKNPYFIQDQAMQEVGLKKVGSNVTPSKLLANAFNLMDEWTNIRPRQSNMYYTYGWSGIVGEKIRYSDSIRFYNELSAEIKKLRTKDINPKIRIVGYCHGGVVALNLARVMEEENLPQTFTVDELILLAMPISKKMRTELHSPLFKKIYNIYSCMDGVQRFDLLAPGSLFSKRIFTPSRKIKLPNKLKQIEIKIMVNKKNKKKCLDNMSPYHLENWFFGWTCRGYRKEFPLYPLPTAAIIPAIVKAADNWGDKHCVIDLRPNKNKLTVHNKNQNYSFTINLFPKKENLSKLLSIVPQSSIVKRTQEEYWDNVNIGIKKAKQKIALEQKEKRPLGIA